MTDDAHRLSRLPNPSRMLLADECPEYHNELLSEYHDDLKPVSWSDDKSSSYCAATSISTDSYA